MKHKFTSSVQDGVWAVKKENGDLEFEVAYDDIRELRCKNSDSFIPEVALLITTTDGASYHVDESMVERLLDVAVQLSKDMGWSMEMVTRIAYSPNDFSCYLLYEKP